MSKNEFSVYRQRATSNAILLALAAHHEAGHAFAVVMYGGHVDKATANYDGTGECVHYFPCNEAKWEDEIRICIAGAMAECLAVQRGWRPFRSWRPSKEQGAGHDMEKIDKFVQANMVGADLDAVNVKLDTIINEVFEWVSEPKIRKALRIMAKLLEEGTLKGPIINEIIQCLML